MVGRTGYRPLSIFSQGVPMTTSRFPSLAITPHTLRPQGDFAVSQARFLSPSPQVVQGLSDLLRRANAGVAAHFYMDPEVQGALLACDWPHVHVSDSLAMASRAMEMIDAGVSSIVVMGVDFMAENVRAVLDASGYWHVPVYRLAHEPIGCSLAEAADSPAYVAYLDRAAAQPRSLHVIYINTSLHIKAQAHRRVPTITCTSSNAVRTVLQAAVQIPDVHIWFGPDAYMGRNLQRYIHQLLSPAGGALRELHPDMDDARLVRLLDNFHFFEDGVCVVHEMFGARVARVAREEHPEAMVAAHLEVPGEMFELALEAQDVGRGVVGSTANILEFITGTVANPPSAAPLQFILGTETGMITTIVRQVQAILRQQEADGRTPAQVEILFPSSPEAVTPTHDAELPVVPGAASGEGCSTTGGCAACPYMKMNTLAGLRRVLGYLEQGGTAALASYAPRRYPELLGGLTVAELGTRPILQMRAFQAAGQLPEDLVARVMAVE